MKKLLVSAAMLAAASTSAFAQTAPGGGAAATPVGTFSFIVAPVVSTNTVSQTALAMPINTTTTTILGAGATSSSLASSVNQTANAVNVFSSSLLSGVRY